MLTGYGFEMQFVGLPPSIPRTKMKAAVATRYTFMVNLMLLTFGRKSLECSLLATCCTTGGICL